VHVLRRQRIRCWRHVGVGYIGGVSDVGCIGGVFGNSFDPLFYDQNFDVLLLICPMKVYREF
jgi:hypothetical protein